MNHSALEALARLCSLRTVQIRAHDRRLFEQLTDWLAVAVVVSLPWSTSATSILIALWLITVLPTMNVVMLQRALRTFAGAMPVLLWLLAVVGVLWSDVGWFERLTGLASYHRLLVIPLLLAHFRHSERGMYVFYGLLISVGCLLALSWLSAVMPAWVPFAKQRGVPVKDYIFQSEMFLGCAFVLIEPAWRRLRAGSYAPSALLFCLAAAFLANIAFVVTSRTALVVAPCLILALGLRQFKPKEVVVTILIACALATLGWLSSSPLRNRVYASFAQARAYAQDDEANSTGLHIDFLRRSFEIVEKAPFIGHGTGSIGDQFRRLEVEQAGAAATVLTVNPHNQIFAVAIDLGCLGAVILLAMWGSHLMLFRGRELSCWIGQVLVIQNVVSSLFNSHLFDFTSGWLYVFGVGIAGGMVLRQRPSSLDPNITEHR